MRRPVLDRDASGAIATWVLTRPTGEAYKPSAPSASTAEQSSRALLHKSRGERQFQGGWLRLVEFVGFHQREPKRLIAGQPLPPRVKRGLAHIVLSAEGVYGQTALLLPLDHVLPRIAP